MRTFLMFLVVIFISVCQSSLTSGIYDYGEEFQLAIGKDVKMGAQKTSVEFINVFEDSRSSINVQCVWTGNGKIELRFGSDKIQLNTYLEPKVTSIADVQIELLNLDPYPEHPRQFEKEDYKVRLRITKD